MASASKAVARTATVAQGLALPIWANDDAKYTSGTGAPMTRPRPVVSLVWAKFRGPGKVTFDSDKPKIDVISGGKQDEPFSGKSTATAKFSEPGEYLAARDRQRLFRHRRRRRGLLLDDGAREGERHSIEISDGRSEVRTMLASGSPRHARPLLPDRR